MFVSANLVRATLTVKAVSVSGINVRLSVASCLTVRKGKDVLAPCVCFPVLATPNVQMVKLVLEDFA